MKIERAEVSPGRSRMAFGQRVVQRCAASCRANGRRDGEGSLTSRECRTREPRPATPASAEATGGLVPHEDPQSVTATISTAMESLRRTVTASCPMTGTLAPQQVLGSRSGFPARPARFPIW